jgi:hypothetical protein
LPFNVKIVLGEKIMNYHISTGLILQEFPKNNECPLCAIKKIVEKNIAEQFLNDAVMEDDTRAKVNKLGFCSKHFDYLFKSQNKLSLALQAQTRMRTFERLIESSLKNPKKIAEEIEKTSSTCIICDLIDFNMVRYYKTVAQMYLGEKEFPKMLSSTKGFCLHHYAELLRYSSHAGVSAKKYAKDLAEIQSKNISRMQGELQWFCDKHDYRNREKPLGTSADILPRMRTKFYGDD